MARYRCINARIWIDDKFRELPDPSQLAFLFVYGQMDLTNIGAMYTTIGTLATKKKWSNRKMRRALQPVMDNKMIVFDERHGLLWFRNYLKYHKPWNANIVKSWLDAFDLLPDCGLKDEIILGTAGYLLTPESDLANHYVIAFFDPLQQRYPAHYRRALEQYKDAPALNAYLTYAAAGRKPPAAAQTTDKSRQNYRSGEVPLSEFGLD